MKGFNFLQFISGIAVFIYAMSLIENSVKNLAGRSFKKFLQKQSGNGVKMIAASTVVTAFLQSSSVVVLMVLSFVGTGLINLRGALAATLGCNLGTTFDSWIIALIGFKIDYDSLSFPILGIALIGLLFFRKNSLLKHLTNFLIGFALIFIALEWFKTSVDKSLEDYLGSFSNLNYLYFIPIGFLITAVIQSSSATIAITLSALFNHLITFESAAAVVIGSELGTTLKFLIGSIGGNANKKLVAWGNFFMNLMTMIFATVLLKPLLFVIREPMGIESELTGLVAFQTGINLISAIAFYPFIGSFTAILKKVVREKPEDGLTLYIHKSTPALPEDALDIAEAEITHLIRRCMELNKQVFKITREKNWFSGLIGSGSRLFPESYNKLKLLQGEILEYITDIPKEGISEAGIEKTGKLINIARHTLRSSKNLKDIYHNLEDFKSSANDELFKLYTEMTVLAKAFYETFEKTLNDVGNATAESISTLTAENRKQYDSSIAQTLLALKKSSISELDASDLMNVYREIYSSNKGLIRALADLKDLEAED